MGFYFIYFSHGATAHQWPWVSSLSSLHDRTQTLHTRWDSSGQVISPTQKTSTLQHTTLTTDRNPCRRRVSNPQPQLVKGRRPTPQSTRPWYLHLLLFWALYKFLRFIYKAPTRFNLFSSDINNGQARQISKPKRFRQKLNSCDVKCSLCIQPTKL